MPSIVLVHRDELVWQAKERIETTTGLPVSIEMGEYSTVMRPKVVVATVQTLYSRRGDRCRMGKFDPMRFGCLIADEFHHYAAPRFKEVIDYFRQNPDLRMMGCTATPKRHDGIALSNICESVAYQYVIKQGVDDGWLVDIKAKEAFVESLDLSGLHTSRGDFVEAELARLMEEEKSLHGVASTTLQEIGTRRAIVYTVRVKQAERLCEIFNRHKNGCAFVVDGKTNKELRRHLLAAFKAGEFQILCNVGIATEGFDDPGIGAIVMARPTLSASLCEQMIGRGDRPLPGVVDGPGRETPELRKALILASAKPDCLVVDLAGNCGKHKLATAIDVLAGDAPEPVRARAIKIAKESNGAVSVTGALSEAEEELKEEKRKYDERRARDAERRSQIKPTATYTYKWLDLWGEGYSDYSGSQHAHTKTLTLAQYSKLKKNGIDPTKLNYWQATRELARLASRPASEKQIWKIKSLGGTPDPEITITEASRLISKLVANNK
jgi:superfamily II DNA or RNA helicase